MTLSAAELADRLAIQDLLVRYTECVDDQDWDALDEVFTADALIDFTATGGPRGDLSSTKAFLARALPAFAAYQHLLGPPRVELSGDTARARTICHNPMVTGTGEQARAWFVGLWYDDRLARTDAGWRISRRSQRLSYSGGGVPVSATGARPAPPAASAADPPG